MALLIAVSAYQNRVPDPFKDKYVAFALPEAGDVETTASIGAARGEFDVFSEPTRIGARPGPVEAEIETLRREIVALRRSSDTLRRQNELMSGRLAMLEGTPAADTKRAPSYAPPRRYARTYGDYGRVESSDQPAADRPRRVAEAQAVDPIITGSIGNAPTAMSDARAAPRTEFGIDLGTYVSLADVASAWNAMRVTEAAVITPLSPLAAVSEASGKMEAHLVAGPFTNAADAAAACARLEKRRIDCKPTLYAGQPLPAR